MFFRKEECREERKEGGRGGGWVGEREGGWEDGGREEVMEGRK